VTVAVALGTSAVIAAYVKPAAARAGDVCATADGDCFEPHGTPGCNLPECCEIVCAIDPSCCSGPWDDFCAEAATLECEPPACPGEGSCFDIHAEEGCDDEACCELVCGLDPFCCDGAWDASCVAIATTQCAAGSCTITCPPEALAEPEPCGEDVNAGCDHPPFQFTPIDCGDVYCGTVDAGGQRDGDWYALVVAEETELSWTVTSEFPATLAVVTGDCLDGFSAVDVAFAGGCGTGALSFCAGPGTYWLVVTSGVDEGSIFFGIACEGAKEPGVVGGRYSAALTCDACGACPADLDGDGTVEVDDLLLVIGAWGQTAHPADLDGDGVVEVDDLLIVIGAWGPC
jgi:hypothetical protein